MTATLPARSSGRLLADTREQLVATTEALLDAYARAKMAFHEQLRIREVTA